MSKISPEHLARSAYVYVRQSTADQLRHNHESRRRQYALADRARVLGWSEVVVIDDDLGVSAGGVARPGFERLLAAICSGEVGAVVSIEASRLARNGRDWHTLLEFCALVGSVIIDEDGVYDPRLVNDRLLLGMKGTMSEMELSLLRQRSVEALKLKAARGDLHTTVAIGFVRSEDDRIELDPDLRIREAIAAVFARFAQAGSIRQVLLWFRQERIEFIACLRVVLQFAAASKEFAKLRVAGSTFELCPAELNLHPELPGFAAGREAVPFQRSLDHTVASRVNGRAETVTPREDQHEHEQRESDAGEEQQRPPHAAKLPQVERGNHGLRVRVSLRRAWVQAAVDDRREIGVHPWNLAVFLGLRRMQDELAICCKLRFEITARQRCGLVVRRLPREHPVHHRPEGVHIPASVGRCRQVGLLGCHIEERAERRGHLVCEPRLSEVREAWPTIVIEQDVRGLQIAVQNPLVVSVNQGDRDLVEEADGLVRGKVVCPQQVFERTVLHELHDIVRRISLPPDFE